MRRHQLSKWYSTAKQQGRKQIQRRSSSSTNCFSFCLAQQEQTCRKNNKKGRKMGTVGLSYKERVIKQAIQLEKPEVVRFTIDYSSYSSNSAWIIPSTYSLSLFLSLLFSLSPFFLYMMIYNNSFFILFHLLSQHFTHRISSLSFAAM